MSAPDPTGEAIGAHWVLISAIVGGVIGFGMLVRLIFLSLKAGREQLHEEINEGIMRSLANGLGKRIEASARAGVVAALADHQLNCPWRDRVKDQGRRMLILERAILEAEAADKDEPDTLE
jgi:hypothetical protein